MSDATGELIGEADPGVVARLVDRLRDAAAILSLDGRLLYANAAARRLLATGPLELRAGRVMGRTPEGRQEFLTVLAGAAAGRPQLARLGGRSSSIILSVTMDAPQGKERTLFLVAHGCFTRSAELPDRLRALFGLTPAEAQIAVRLARGATTTEIARTRGVAASTVRAQIKLLFAKLGCASRGELTALVTSVPHLQEGCGA